ncbi:hypothetical protein [Plantactinospora sp. DSM 117369]
MLLNVNGHTHPAIRYVACFRLPTGKFPDHTRTGQGKSWKRSHNYQSPNYVTDVSLPGRLNDRPVSMPGRNVSRHTMTVSTHRAGEFQGGRVGFPVVRPIAVIGEINGDR